MISHKNILLLYSYRWTFALIVSISVWILGYCLAIKPALYRLNQLQVLIRKQQVAIQSHTISLKQNTLPTISTNHFPKINITKQYGKNISLKYMLKTLQNHHVDLHAMQIDATEIKGKKTNKIEIKISGETQHLLNWLNEMFDMTSFLFLNVKLNATNVKQLVANITLTILSRDVLVRTSTDRLAENTIHWCPLNMQLSNKNNQDFFSIKILKLLGVIQQDQFKQAWFIAKEHIVVASVGSVLGKEKATLVLIHPNWVMLQFSNQKFFKIFRNPKG